MRLSLEEVDRAASDLLSAEIRGSQIELLSERFPGLSMEDAYRVQAALVEAKLKEGRRIIGRKIGLTSRAMQRALNIATPDTGVLFDDMLFENGADIPVGRFIQPRIEVEIAFVMKSRLAGTETVREHVIASTDHVSPAIEILDTRILRKSTETGRLRNVCDTIADNAANAGIILGGGKHGINDFELCRVGAVVMANNEVEETGMGAGVLGDPISGIVWLERRLAENGQAVEAGDILLSGSFIRPVEAPPGTWIHADFGPFGSVRCGFPEES